MKALKFRTWLPKQKIFHYWGFDLHENEAWFHGPPNEPKAPQMQFTGLLDKNGVEIYEGDIRIGKWHSCSDPKEYVGYQVMKWDDASACFSWDGVYIPDFIRIEVVGNIYENKELLDGNAC